MLKFNNIFQINQCPIRLLYLYTEKTKDYAEKEGIITIYLYGNNKFTFRTGEPE